MTGATKLILVVSLIFFAFGAGMLVQSLKQQPRAYSAPALGDNPATANQDMNGFNITNVPRIDNTSGALFSTTVGGFQFERTTTGTSNADDVFAMTRTTSGDMTDGFGSLFRFRLKDNSGVVNLVAQLGAIRDGADNEGAMVFLAGTNGLEEFMRLDRNGNLNLNTSSPRITSNGEICIGSGC